MSNSNYQLTRSQLDKWFNTPSQLLSWEQIATEMATLFNKEVTAEDAKGVFRANNYNLQQRPMKARLSDLVTVVEDVTTEIVSQSNTEATEPVYQEEVSENGYAYNGI